MRTSVLLFPSAGSASFREVTGDVCVHPSRCWDVDLPASACLFSGLIAMKRGLTPAHLLCSVGFCFP